MTQEEKLADKFSESEILGEKSRWADTLNNDKIYTLTIENTDSWQMGQSDMGTSQRYHYRVFVNDFNELIWQEPHLDDSSKIDYVCEVNSGHPQSISFYLDGKQVRQLLRIEK